jgi:hypothetical protein
MMHCSPSTQGDCVRQELGIVPFHMSCDLWLLNYWHHLRTMSKDRLLSQVVKAWSGPANPWQRTVDKLLAEYQVSAADTLGYSKHKFSRHVRAKITGLLKERWASATSRTGGAILARYVGAFGTGEMKRGMNGYQPAARSYMDYLTGRGRGLPAELIMGLRIESLPLRCMHSNQRRHETVVQQQQRELCPVCKQSPETPAHFLLECPDYTAARTPFFNVLRTTHPDKMCAVEQLPAIQVWRSLLADDIIKEAVTEAVAAGPGPTVTAFDGVRPPVTGNAVDGTATSAAAPGSAAALGSAAAPGAITVGGGEAAHAVVLPGSAAVCVGDGGRFKTLHALADYLVSAWKLRSTALAGRETNGGNPMV